MSDNDKSGDLKNFVKSPEGITKVGQYDILYEIDSGGMGKVFYGRDEDLERPVAIKMLSPELFANEDMQLKFIQEAKTIAKLDHPNIIKIYNIEFLEKNVFLIMEYVKGNTLSKILSSKRILTVSRALKILSPLANALAYAHSKGIIHLDIKPSNIMITDENVLKLMDFGISHDKEKADSKAPEGLGTPKYMAPELFTKDDIDHRTDIYAFGVLAYEMLTGNAPFVCRNYSDYMQNHLFAAPAPIDKKVPDCSRHLRKFISQCLEKNKDKRPQTLELFENSSEQFIRRNPLLESIKSGNDKTKSLMIILLVILLGLNGFLFFRNLSGFKSKNPVIQDTDKLIENIIPQKAEYKDDLPLNKDTTGLPPDNSELKAGKDQTITVKKENEVSITPKAGVDTPLARGEAAENKSVEALIKETSFPQLLIKLSKKNTDFKWRQEALQALLWTPKEEMDCLIPLVNADDPELVKNITYVLGLRNIQPAFKVIKERIEGSKDEEFRSELFRSLGYFSGGIIESYKNFFLNNAFLESISLIEMENLMEGLHGKAVKETVNKARMLLSLLDAENLKGKVYLFLTSNGDKSGLVWARKNIVSDDVHLRIISLSILSYSANPKDLELILAIKRSFYMTIPLMNEFMKTKAILSTVDFDGAKRFDLMEKECLKNNAVLAWLALYVAKANHPESKEWLKAFYSRYDLKIYRDYIHAYYYSGEK